MAHLFPLESCQLDSLTWGEHQVELHLRTSSPQAACPSCQIGSSHVHSRYRRTIVDLPWADYTVIVHLRNAAALDSVSGRPLPTLHGATAPARTQAAQAHWHTDATTRYYTIHGMAAQQVSVAAIARTLAISRPTVYRYLRMADPPRYAQIQRTRRSVLDPVKPYIAQRWNEGCRNARHLWQELQDHGITISLRTVNRFVAALREESGVRARTFRQQPAAQHYAQNITQRRPLSALQAMRLLMTAPMSGNHGSGTICTILPVRSHESRRPTS